MQRTRNLLLTASLVLCSTLLSAGIATAADTSYTQIQRGRYLVKAGDCAACHTAQGGQSFAGGRGVPTPFGVIYSTNITPDKETGIGQWSQKDFYTAMHHGIDREGKHLYPAFPYPWFTKLTRDDVNAVKAYLDILEPVKQANKPTELPWPLSWRGAMVFWNALFFKAGDFKPQTDKSAVWNRGAYLVESAGHCAACHTPKNMLGGSKHDDHLMGGDAGENWYAPSLTGDVREGLGNWSKQDVVDYLKTGSNARTAAAGSMADVIRDSTQYLTDGDLDAIATYLKEVPASKTVHTTAITIDQQVMTRGAGLYVDNCAACHMQNGKGLPHIFPSIAGSSVLHARQPDTLIHLVLTGFKRPATVSKPTEFAMPAFDTKLNDAEIADLVSYIRNAWGNQATPVSAANVTSIRKDLADASTH